MVSIIITMNSAATPMIKPIILLR